MTKRINFNTPTEIELPVDILPPLELLNLNVRFQQRSQPQAYILQTAHEQIWNHVNQNPSMECGGVLVGHPFKTPDRQITYVVVTAAISQPTSNRGYSHFTVGPAEIAIARQKMESLYPGLMFVGWYHSHPGFGCYLSAQDMQIVQSIYNSTWNIACVVDSITREEKIFIGAEGEDLDGGWLKLSQAPNSLKLIALYNQIKESIGSNKKNQYDKLLLQLEKMLSENASFVSLNSNYLDLALLKNYFK